MKYTHSFLQLMLFIFGLSTPSFTHLAAASSSAHAPRRLSIKIDCEHLEKENSLFQETDAIDFSFESPVQGVSPHFMITQGENTTGDYLVITLSPGDVTAYSKKLMIKVSRKIKDSSLSIGVLPSLSESLPDGALEYAGEVITKLEYDTKSPLGIAQYQNERQIFKTADKTTVILMNVPKVSFNLSLDTSIRPDKVFYRIPPTGNARINFIFPLPKK